MNVTKKKKREKLKTLLMLETTNSRTEKKNWVGQKFSAKSDILLRNDVRIARSCTLVACFAQNGQNVNENVDDIQVDVEGGENVFFRRNRVLVVAADHQLRVVD